MTTEKRSRDAETSATLEEALPTSVEERVRSHLVEVFYVGSPAALTDDTSLIETGLVDSTGMMDVILFLETEFGIEVGDEDTTPENLETIRRIAQFVDRKRRIAGREPSTSED